MNKPYWYLICSVVLAPFVLVAAVVGNNTYTRRHTAYVADSWQAKLAQANLIGTSKTLVSAYLTRNGLPLGGGDVSQSGSTCWAVDRVGYTYDPLPTHRGVMLDFQFNKRGKLTSYKTEPYTQEFDM